MTVKADRFLWTRHHMPMVYALADELLKESDRVVLISLPLTWETLCLIDAIRHKLPNLVVIPLSSGANSSLEPGVFPYLEQWGIPHYTTASEENRVAALRHGPDIILDCTFALGSTAIRHGLLGDGTIVIEQTKTGENSIASHGLDNPFVVLDNSEFKREHENKEAVGYSVIAGLTSMGLYLPRRTVGIIGYGYVGMGLAKYAKAAGAEVLVYEMDETKRQAAAEQYRVVSKHELLAKADIVITATGHRDVITRSDLAGLDRTVMLANAGGEDEWDRAMLHENGPPLKIHEHITQSTVGSCTVWEICGGNSVNLAVDVSLSEFLDITFSHLVTVVAQLETATLAPGKNDIALFDASALEGKLHMAGWPAIR